MWHGHNFQNLHFSPWIYQYLKIGPYTFNNCNWCPIFIKIMFQTQNNYFRLRIIFILFLSIQKVFILYFAKLPFYPSSFKNCKSAQIISKTSQNLKICLQWKIQVSECKLTQNRGQKIQNMLKRSTFSRTPRTLWRTLEHMLLKINLEENKWIHEVNDLYRLVLDILGYLNPFGGIHNVRKSRDSSWWTQEQIFRKLGIWFVNFSVYT
jgi:hypothetical protein